MFTFFILTSSFTKMASLGDKTQQTLHFGKINPSGSGTRLESQEDAKSEMDSKNKPDELEALYFQKRKFHLFLYLFSPLFLRFRAAAFYFAHRQISF